MTSAPFPESLWVLLGKGPWGDYGNILVHGMSAHLARVDDRIQLERTAPFIPPLSLPGIGDIVVTDELRRQLEDAKISGVVFRPVDKAHVVYLDWSEWDRSVDSPAVYPESGEPEDYILAQRHDPAAAVALGTLWEVVPGANGSLACERFSRTPRAYRFTWQPGPEPVADVFRAENMRYVLVTDRLRRILAAVDCDALEFHPVVVGELPPPQPPAKYQIRPGEPVPIGYQVTGSLVSPFTGEILQIATRKVRTVT